jgi:hypothetical protein
MIARTILLIAALLAAPGVHAQLFKCVGADGKTSYQAEPCPEAAKGQRMGTSPGASAKGPWKDGWSANDFEFMAVQCRDNVIIPARRGYANHGVAFPEQLVGEMNRHCDCVVSRIASRYSMAEYKARFREINDKVRQDALNGVACAPEGLHAELVKRGWEENR